MNLSAADAQLLDREGSHKQLELLYLFKLGGGQHILAPAVKYTAYDLDGKAMANDQYSFLVTHYYFGKRFDFATNLVYTFADYDELHPIYNKTRKDDIYGATFSAFYKRLFDIPNMSLVGTIAAVKDDSNIDFYTTQISMVSITILYRF